MGASAPDVEPLPDDVAEPAADRPYGGGIGSSCNPSQTCGSPARVCLSDYPSGLCTKPCSRACPDVPGHSLTFCIADRSGTGGICVAKADLTAFPSGGCRTGYHKVTRSRFNEPAKTAEVCVPDTDSAQACENEYSAVSGFVADWSIASVPLSNGATCRVTNPVRSSSWLNGVTLEREGAMADEYVYSSCLFAQTLLRMTEVLHDLGVTKVTYRTLYSCEAGADGIGVSPHGRGEAIDLVAVYVGEQVHSFDTMRIPYDTTFLDSVVQALSNKHIFTSIYTRFCNDTLYPDVMHGDLSLPSVVSRDLGNPLWLIDWAPQCAGYDSL